MGYEQERFVESFSPDLVCSICLCVLEDPQECKNCQSNFCSECITTWRKTNSGCPNKCSLDLQKSHRFLRGVLDNLHIKCVNTSFGCEKVLELCKIKFHEQQECLYRKILCPYPGCELLVPYTQYETHNSNCSFRVLTCGDCGEETNVSSFNLHSCIKSLSTKIQEMLKTYQANEIKLSSLQKIMLNRSDLSINFVHKDIKCSSCLKNPIVGIRTTCLNCPDFNLCSECEVYKHADHEFFQVTHMQSHFGVTCDGCFESPIKGLRFKCKECNDFDFCKKCRFTAQHPHDQFYLWTAYVVEVTPVKPERIGYRDGDTLIRQWEVFNKSTQTIKDIVFTCVYGDTCSKEYLAKGYVFEFPGVEIVPLGKTVLTIKEKIFQPIPGLYKCELSMSTSSRISQFGPILKYALAILQ